MKYYYAQFIEQGDQVEVTFPDLPGCVTFASSWDAAVVNATDVLAGWLAHAESKFIKKPSTYDDLKSGGRVLIPIPIDENILASYQELKRFNVIFPANLLYRVDQFRKQNGLKRSTFLLRASEEYLQHHVIE